MLYSSTFPAPHPPPLLNLLNPILKYNFLLQYVNATSVLSELQKLNEDVFTDEPQEAPHQLQLDDEDIPTPQDVLSHIKEFEQEIVSLFPK